MFNVRVKRFYDTEQIQVFSKAMHSKGEIERKKFDRYTGEIYTRPTGELIENPFTGESERVRRMVDLEEYARKSCSRTIKKIYDIARSNRWEWFMTFTFNEKRVRRYDYNDCTAKMSNWLKNMRKVCPDMVYVVVPEQHKDGAFHFHGLFSNVMELDFKYSGKFDKKGRTVYNIGNYKWGWTTATKIDDFRRASSYLCKYITKDLCAVTRGKKRYWSSRNVELPEVIEYMIEDSEDNRLMLFLEQSTYIKKIETPFTNVTYIEKPID